MENKVFTYLEFALPIHNCVIIPELGGFIINQVEVFNPLGLEIRVPQYTITFNPELKHDDGILVSYYIKDGKMSYNAALQKVKDFVKLLKQELVGQKTVSCGRLGSLSMDKDNKLLFEANKSFVFPCFYGLTAVGLNNLSEINRREAAPKKSFPIRYTVGTIAAAVAAMFLFTVTSVQVNDNLSSKNTLPQQSGFIYSLPKAEKTLLAVDSSESVIPQLVDEEAKKQSLRTYYIIVGGEESRAQAQYLQNKIENSGLKNTSILESGGRYRIYAASFSDKTEAESFLESFRKENPKHETAWLYSKRNH